MKTCSHSLLTTGLLAFLLAVPAFAAEPKAELKDAIQKLREQPNYSWTIKQKTEGSESASRRDGSMEGKAEKSGLVLVKAASGDNAYEVAFKGEKVVVNYNEDWIEPSELPVDSGRIEERLKALKITPVDQASSFATNTTDLKKDASGEYSATMPAEEALAAFKKLGRRAADATEAKGTLKFWIKDGRLDKYEFKVQGKFTVGADKKEVDLTRTTTVEIKDVGSTKISLPEGARNRLS
jgi:hypothetical protein